MDFSGLYQVDHKKKKNKTLGFLKQIVFPVIIIAIIAFLVQLGIRKLLFFPVKIETNSMDPAIPQGTTKFLVYPHLATISKNDIVFIKLGKLDFFCRIAGTEGNAVQILDKSLFVNHVEVKNYNKLSKDSTSFKQEISPRDNTPEYLIGPNEYFCLNDNWENLQDSRLRGPIEIKNIKGKVLFQ